MDLTVRDAAALFNVSESRIYGWIHEDDLPTREVNGQQYFNRTELLEWATIRRVKFSPDLFRDPSRGTAASEGLVDALQLGGIVPGVAGADKREVLREVVNRMPLPEGFERSILLQLFLARESAASTAIGDGIAIPHPRQPLVLPVGRPTLTICLLDRPVDFGASDGQPVHTLFVLVSPTIRAHLRMLARIACLLREGSFRALLKRRGSPEEILHEVKRVEETFVNDSAQPREPA